MNNQFLFWNEQSCYCREEPSRRSNKSASSKTADGEVRAHDLAVPLPSYVDAHDWVLSLEVPETMPAPKKFPNFVCHSDCQHKSSLSDFCIWRPSFSAFRAFAFRSKNIGCFGDTFRHVCAKGYKKRKRVLSLDVCEMPF